VIIIGFEHRVRLTFVDIIIVLPELEALSVTPYHKVIFIELESITPEEVQ
jgi:hypothetical protein